MTFVVTSIAMGYGWQGGSLEAFGYCTEEVAPPVVTHEQDRSLGARKGDMISRVIREDPPSRRLAYKDPTGRWVYDPGVPSTEGVPMPPQLLEAVERVLQWRMRQC